MIVDPDTYRRIAIKHGLRLWAKTGIMPNTAWTLTKMLGVATVYTGTTYPRSRKGADSAISDLDRITE